MGALMPGEKPKNFQASLKRLLSYIRTHLKSIILIVILSIIATVFTTLGPRISSLAIDEIARGVMSAAGGGELNIDFTYLVKVLTGLGGLYLVGVVFNYLQGFIVAKISTGIAFRMRTDIMGKINRLPFSYFNSSSTGDVLSRITNDVDTLSMNLSNTLTQAISSVVTVVGVLAMMLSLSWQLTIISLVTLPLSGLFVSQIVKRSQKFFRSQQELLGTVNGHIEEMFGAHVVVKAFNGEDDAIGTFENVNDKLYNAAWRSQFLSSLMMPIMGFIGNLSYVLVCIIGGYLAVNGSMTIGGIQAFIQYVRSFNQPIQQIAGISNQLQQALAAAERVFNFLDEPEETDDQVALRLADIDVKGDISFEDIRFGYEGSDKLTITGFSANVKAGQKIAIVGPTGAGKTTMIKLLMRFHDINSGKITLDGHDTTRFRRQDVRQAFGMVLQDAWLFSGTIMDNIRYGKLNATDEEVIAAAKAAQIDHFIRTLPGGYHMELNEETSNVSQGQRQLLTIARAISILLL
jgi:ATP-binding cassette subfamily B protein